MTEYFRVSSFCARLRPNSLVRSLSSGCSSIHRISSAKFATKFSPVLYNEARSALKGVGKGGLSKRGQKDFFDPLAVADVTLDEVQDLAISRVDDCRAHNAC